MTQGDRKRGSSNALEEIDGPLAEVLGRLERTLKERSAREAAAPADTAPAAQGEARKRSLAVGTANMRGNGPARPPAKKRTTRQPNTVSGKVLVNGDMLRPEHVAYNHSLFLQCALPVRHSDTNRLRWEIKNGRATLLIRAGELGDPQRPGTFKQCEVPAGPKARLIAAYVNDYAYRHNTRTIPLGASMREAMGKLGVKVGGHNGKELTRELENFAAADIYLGLWDEDGNAATHKAAVAKSMSFWVERDERKRAFWTPELELSAEYAEALRTHMAPTYWPALIGLQHNARAMDVHAFLQSRLVRVKKPVFLPAPLLHGLFGQGIKQLDHFWPHFLKALTEARRFYQAARLDLQADGVLLHRSPPLLPSNK